MMNLLTRLTLTICSLAAGISAYAQHAVTGTVQDASGQPVIGASVIIQGTNNGTVVNVDGSYTLSNASIGDRIEFSCIGYTSQVLVFNGQPLNVILAEDMEMLEGTVVTALGIRRSEKALSYNVQQIDPGTLTNVKSTNVMGSLAGKIAGVNINTSSAGVGGATRVVMRGPKSLNQSNQTLYVIDGVPFTNRNEGETSDMYSVQPGSEGIADINPEDIESIAVLSGPAAAALYGSAAAQGVIMITTKKGRVGGLSVTVANNTSFNNTIRLPSFQNRYLNRPGEVKSWGEKGESAYGQYDPAKFFNVGFNVQNSVAITKGSEHNQTYLSVGTTNATGIITGNTYNRYNVAFRNSSSLLDDKLSIDFSFNYIKERDANLMAQGQYFNPLTSVYLFPRGESFDAVRTFEIWDPSRRIYVQNWNFGNALQMQNPYWIAKRMDRSNSKHRYMVNGSVRYNVFDWLNITARIRWDDAVTKSEQKRYASTITLFTAGSQYGFYGYSKNDDRSLYGDLMANVNKTFGEFTLGVNAGGSLSRTTYDVGGFQGGLRGPSNIFNPFTIDYGNAQNDNRPYYVESRHNIHSLFSNIEVGWRSFMYLTLTGRYDWDSALANTDHPGFFYPSVGLSAVLSDIIQLPKWWPFLKLRASWASVGSAVGTGITSPWRYTYNAASQTYETNTYRFPKNFYPEKTNSWEAGIQSRWFDGMLTVDVTLYQSNTYKQTFLRTITAAGGYSAEYYQAGNVRNRGIEASLAFNNTWGAFTWNTNLTFSANQNKIIELYADNPDEVISKGGLNGASIILKQGGTMGDVYVSTDFKRDSEGYIALDASGNIQRETLTNPLYKGSVLPKANLGWANEFTFKNVHLGFLISARLGGIVLSQTQAILDEYGVSERSAIARDKGGINVNTGTLSAEQYFSVVGGDNPIWSEYIYDATNVRLQEAHIGYTFPTKWLGGKELYVGITANNLLMLFCRAPFDPESTASTGTYYQGFDYFMQPSLRSCGFNIRLKF